MLASPRRCRVKRADHDQVGTLIDGKVAFNAT
jgi:hypothetical protein